MIRRPPRSTLFSLHDALPISTYLAMEAFTGQANGWIGQSARMGVRSSQPAWRSALRPYSDGCGSKVDRKSTRLNSSHSQISYAVFCLKKKKKIQMTETA